MRRSIALLGIVLVSGCAATGAPKTSVDRSAATTFSVPRAQPPSGARSIQDVSKENTKNLEAGLEDVLNYCLPRLSGFESRSEHQARLAFWLSMSGLLAGAVIAPALTAAAAQANAAWIAALSGWAGATNFAGQVLRTSGLSGSTIAETRNTIIQNVKKQIAIAMDGENSFEERRAALLQARAECALYEIAVPSVADAPTK